MDYRNVIEWYREPKGSSPEGKREVEAFIGRAVPEDLDRLILECGEGRPLANCYPNVTRFGRPDEYGVGVFLPYSSDSGEGEDILGTIELGWTDDERLTICPPRGLLPFAVDGGGCYACYHFAPEDEMHIVLWAGTAFDGEEMSPICRTLDEFIAGLQVIDD